MKETNVTTDVLTVGDIITWNGHWKDEPTKDDEVIAIIITPEGGSDKSLGTPIDSIEMNKMIGKNILLGLKRGLWAYRSVVRKKIL